MLNEVPSLCAATASVAFVLAFIAAWFEPAKRTAGTLLGLVALGVLTYTAGASSIESLITSEHQAVTNPSLIQLFGLALAGVGVLLYSRRPVTMTLPDAPIRRWQSLLRGNGPSAPSPWGRGGSLRCYPDKPQSIQKAK